MWVVRLTIVAVVLSLTIIAIVLSLTIVAIVLTLTIVAIVFLLTIVAIVLSPTVAAIVLSPTIVAIVLSLTKVVSCGAILRVEQGQGKVNRFSSGPASHPGLCNTAAIVAHSECKEKTHPLSCEGMPGPTAVGRLSVSSPRQPAMC